MVRGVGALVVALAFCACKKNEPRHRPDSPRKQQPRTAQPTKVPATAKLIAKLADIPGAPEGGSIRAARAECAFDDTNLYMVVEPGTRAATARATLSS